MKTLKGMILIPLALTMLAFPKAYAQSPTEKQSLSDLKWELAQVEGELSQAAAEGAQYSSGLIKELIGVRLQVLKTNRALIQQRVHAIESGTKITIVITGTKPDPERTALLEEDIRQQRTKLAEARAYADQYTGGLLEPIAECFVALSQQVLSMLEQQYLLAKYGLNLPYQPMFPAEPRAATVSPGKQPQPEGNRLGQQAYRFAQRGRPVCGIGCLGEGVRCQRAGAKRL